MPPPAAYPSAVRGQLLKRALELRVVLLPAREIGSQAGAHLIGLCFPLCQQLIERLCKVLVAEIISMPRGGSTNVTQ